jgi:tetratricopeptide (TPR) repeat protein
MSPRQEAEQAYAMAYEEIGKANKELAKGKAKNAEKRFRKALEQAERATQFDQDYYEAWNLVGFAARNLTDYEKSVKAYQKSLELKFDYAAAREYLGETYLAMGNIEEARGQLGMLERLKATEEHAKLSAAIDKWVAAHPEAANRQEANASTATTTTAQPATTPAPADSARTP